MEHRAKGKPPGPCAAVPKAQTDLPSMPPSRAVLRIISICLAQAPIRLLHAGDSPHEMPV